MQGSSLAELCQLVANLLEGSQRALFITGAGISADAGIPTYRGIGGLGCHDAWAPGFDLERELDAGLVHENPARAWETYREIERESRMDSQDPTHAMLSHFCQAHHEAWILTQNVDGLHRRAESPNLVELNGNLRDPACIQCDWRASVSTFDDLPAIPRCPECGLIARPACSLLGEPPLEEAMCAIERELEQGFDVVACIGTSGAAPLINDILHRAHARETKIVDINLGDSNISRAANIRLPVSPSIGVQRVLELFPDVFNAA